DEISNLVDLHMGMFDGGWKWQDLQGLLWLDHHKNDKENRSLKDDKRKGHLKEVIIIDSNTSSSSDDIPLSTETLETSSDDIPPSTHPFQASSDDTLKSSSEYTWYDDLSSNEKRAVFKDKSGSSSTSSSSKHLASRTHSNSNPYQAKLRSSSKDVQADVGVRAGSLNLLVPTKRPHPVWNCALGLAVVKTWAQILNKEFGIKNPKKMLEQVHMLLGKGKGRWCRTNLCL
ncbi:hypothetical protein Tco_1049485, partial [Tanacetum coccineum]